MTCEKCFIQKKHKRQFFELKFYKNKASKSQCKKKFNFRKDSIIFNN